MASLTRNDLVASPYTLHGAGPFEDGETPALPAGPAVQIILQVVRLGSPGAAGQEHQ